MILNVVVKPNAKKSEILEQGDGFLKVAIAAPPDKNKANKELIRFLSKHLKKKVRIKSGLSSREKVVEVED
ncbi:MAG: DUF167 domain-containing protein [Nanoarchaeota archaeon]